MKCLQNRTFVMKSDIWFPDENYLKNQPIMSKNHRLIKKRFFFKNRVSSTHDEN